MSAGQDRVGLSSVSVGADAKQGTRRRFLFFPLANALGHLVRSFALAEELAADGHTVVIATDDSYPELATYLPKQIRTIETVEMHPLKFDFVPCSPSPTGGRVEAMANLRRGTRLPKSDLARRAIRLKEMLIRDTEILEEVRPDVIVADQRISPHLLVRSRRPPVFQIANILGYSSVHQRAYGHLPFPLERGKILVPGLREIECWRRRPPPRRSELNVTFCGFFGWRGWERMPDVAPSVAEVLFFFGSTGNGEQITPRLIQKVPRSLSINWLGASDQAFPARAGLRVTRFGRLKTFLAHAQVLLCHGGHGTVMEAIYCRKPTVIFPSSLEQWEVGRRIDRMRLGVLAHKPWHKYSSTELAGLIDRAATDSRIQANLARFSQLLHRSPGTRTAVNAIYSHLNRQNSES